MSGKAFQKLPPGIKQLVYCKVKRKLKRKLQTIYRKNKDDLRALILGIYPQFVYKNIHKLEETDIPIFVFHSVTPEYFEHQMQYLSENNYRTLKSDELYDTITGNIRPKPKSIVLTFDDGRASLWTTAYPILKKFGLFAICFLLPSYIKNSKTLFPTLENVWSGNVDCSEIEKRELKEPLCSWQEISHMHASGVVDFQSHTSFHHSIFVSSTIVDFLNPDFEPSFLNSDLNPVVRVQGKDSVLDNFDWGRPIYEWAPAMSSRKRYIEDECLSLECIRWVQRNGSISFFQKPDWRKELSGCVADYVNRNGKSERYLSADERYSEIYQDLYQSKLAIEVKLNKEVRHLCYPWFVGSDLSVQASKDAGYVCNYWGILKRRTTNPVGVNPYYLARISDEYLLTLPGKGRNSLFQVLTDKIRRINRQKRNFGAHSQLANES